MTYVTPPTYLRRRSNICHHTCEMLLISNVFSKAYSVWIVNPRVLFTLVAVHVILIFFLFLFRGDSNVSVHILVWNAMASFCELYAVLEV